MIAGYARIQFKRAINIFGKSSQKVMFMEEAAELIKELSKSMRGYDNPRPTIEEIADVQVMLNQLKVMYGEAECEDVYIEKIKNLNRRLNEHDPRNPSN